MKIALIITVIITIIIALAGLRHPGGTWDGRVNRSIIILIKSEDGRSLPGATVLLIQNFDSLTKNRSREEVIEEKLNSVKNNNITDENGVVVLSEYFGAGGGYGSNGRTGRYILTGDIFVMHDDYFDFSAPLSDLIGEKRVSLDMKELGFTASLKSKNPEQAAPSNR